MSAFKWVNDNVKIDFPVSKVMQNTMLEAEEADLAGNHGEYMEISDAIDVLAKNDYGVGAITKDMWDKLCERYPYV